MRPTDFILRLCLALFLCGGACGYAVAAETPRTRLTRSARSGPWSAPGTWAGGRVPGEGARVQVRTGHVVVYDVKSDTVIRSLHVAGTLRFATDRDTRLDVGLLKIQPGDDASENGFDCDAHLTEPEDGADRPALEVGTAEHPLDAAHKALIRLTYVPGMDRESCPALVCCGGRLDLHGAPLGRTWVKLGRTADKGADVVTLAEPVPGWRAGDRVILTATRRDYKSDFTETRLLRSVEGATLTLDRPLDQPHQGDGEYRGEAADLSRNVVVESADPAGVRGHTMYHRHSAGSLSYAEFRHLGKQGVLGRYALHYHLAGNTMRGSSVVGVSVWDSANRWLTVHGTNYLVVRDCVGYRSVGHGFYLEDGTEVFNVLDRNLAVAARRGKKLPGQLLPFDENEGAGFWWANSRNTFTRNVAVGNGQYGFRFEATPTSALPLTLPVFQPDGRRRKVDVRTLPFVRFDGNEAHSTVGFYGVNLGEGVERVGPDRRHPFVVRDLKLWDLHYAFRPQVPSLLVENLTIHLAEYGVYHPNYDNHAYRNVLISRTNTEPFNRGHDDLSVQYGPLTVDGITFDGIRSPREMPLIQISDDNPTGRAVSHFRNLKVVNWTGETGRAIVNRGGGPRPTPKTPKGVPVYVHDWFGPGRDARVVSTKATSDGRDYREEPPLTGDASRAAEVRDVPFPRLLEPIDDLPPTTVITSATRSGDVVLVRGSTADNGVVTKVLVNGRPARALAGNFAEWEISLTAGAGPVKLTARAEDEAGNREGVAHAVVLP